MHMMHLFLTLILAVTTVVVNSVGTGTVPMPEPSKYVLSFPTGDNPMGVKVVRPYSRNYYMVIGDWGAPIGNNYYHVQKKIAKKMQTFYDKQAALGHNLMFVLSLGDNFYWSGQDCKSEFSTDWTDMYGPNITGVPWLSVMGNHDWADADPWSLCAWKNPRYVEPSTGIPYACNQLNTTKGGCNPANYYLPDFGYYYTINELNFELIVLDENYSDCPYGMGGNGPSGGARNLFNNCGGTSVGCGYMKKIRDASHDMFVQRARQSTNMNFMLAQHYPGIGGDLVSEMVHLLPSSQLAETMIVSAYGHEHSQHCRASYNTKYGALCYEILAGGGGGCCSENTRRGFYVVNFDDEKHMITPLQLGDSQLTCQYPCGAWVDEDKAAFDLCCHGMITNCSAFDLQLCNL